MVRNCAPENLEIPGLVPTIAKVIQGPRGNDESFESFSSLCPCHVSVIPGTSATIGVDQRSYAMSLGLILIIILIIFLLGGFSGRFGGYGYGFGHGGVGIIGLILIVVVVLVLLGQL